MSFRTRFRIAWRSSGWRTGSSWMIVQTVRSGRGRARRRAIASSGSSVRPASPTRSARPNATFSTRISRSYARWPSDSADGPRSSRRRRGRPGSGRRRAGTACSRASSRPRRRRSDGGRRGGTPSRRGAGRGRGRARRQPHHQAPVLERVGQELRDEDRAVAGRRLGDAGGLDGRQAEALEMEEDVVLAPRRRRAAAPSARTGRRSRRGTGRGGATARRGRGGTRACPPATPRAAAPTAGRRGRSPGRGGGGAGSRAHRIRGVGERRERVELRGASGGRPRPSRRSRAPRRAGWASGRWWPAVTSANAAPTSRPTRSASSISRCPTPRSRTPASTTRAMIRTIRSECSKRGSAWTATNPRTSPPLSATMTRECSRVEARRAARRCRCGPAG